MAHNLPPKKYPDIENIINLDIIMKDFSPKFLNWYYWNRNNMTWEIFDAEKEKYDPEIRKIIENHFKRTKDFAEHVIMPDCYFKTFILTNIAEIKENYDKYLACVDIEKVRKYLFKIIVLIYALETQHYYHVLNKGHKFKFILTEYNELFDKINTYISNVNNNPNIKETNIQINKYDILGNADFINKKGQLFDIKCCSDISLKHIVQQTVCNILYNELDKSKLETHNVILNFINLITGKILKITLNLTKNKVHEILKIMNDNKKGKG